MTKVITIKRGSKLNRIDNKKKPTTKATMILSSRNPKKENPPVINTSVENIDNNLQGITSKNSYKNFGINELKIRDVYYYKIRNQLMPIKQIIKRIYLKTMLIIYLRIKFLIEK